MFEIIHNFKNAKTKTFCLTSDNKDIINEMKKTNRRMEEYICHAYI